MKSSSSRRLRSLPASVQAGRRISSIDEPHSALKEGSSNEYDVCPKIGTVVGNIVHGVDVGVACDKFNRDWHP